MMRLGSALICAFAAAGAATSSPAAAQAVSDNSFEEPAVNDFVYRPTVAGVTFTGNAGVGRATFTLATPPDGQQFGLIQSGFQGDGQGAISLAVTGLTIGTTYDVSFYGAQRGGPYGVNPIAVSFDGADLGTYTPASASAFEKFTTGNFTASGTAGTLTFTGTQTTGDYDSAIDAVSLGILSVAGAVPEPASWALMILGIGAVGAAARRRGAERVAQAA